MKERLTSIKLFLLQHFFVVGLVLLFVVLSLCSCGRARAAEPYDGVSVDPYNINSLEDALDYMNITSSQKQTILDAFEQYCPYYQIYFDNTYHSMAVNGTDVAGQYVTCPFVDSNPWRSAGMYYLAKADITPTYILQLRIQDTSVALYFINPGAQGDYMLVFNTDFQSLYGNDQTFLQYHDDPGDVLISGSVSPQCSKDSLYCYSIEGQHVLMQDNFSLIRPLGDTPVNGFSESHKFFIRSQPSYVEDERLKISTSLRGDGEKLLNIDLSAFRGNFTPAASYSFSDVVLHLNCDGSDVSYTINDSNSELINSWNPSNNRYVFITPYSFFDLSSYDDVYISGVDFSLSHSSPGGSDTENFKISAEYFLKHETAPIESDDFPFNDNIYSDSVTSGQITSTLNEIGVQSVTSSNGIWNDFDLVSTLPIFPSWASVMSVDIWQAVSYSDGSIDEYLDEYYYRGYDSQSDYKSWYVETNPFDFPSMNYFSQYYDVLVLQLGTAVKNMSVAGSPHGIPTNQVWGQYLILYSARYYQHKNVEGIYNLIDIFQKDAKQSVEFMNYTKSRLDDFENKSLVAFNTLIGLDRQNGQWLSTLNNTLDNGFYSVVAAINNIDIPQPVVFDDSDILDKIDDLIVLLQGLIDGNEVDTPQECIQYFYDNQNGSVDPAFLPAYYEGMTLDFLYSIQGETQNNFRSVTKSGGGSAVLVNNSLLIQIFNQFKDSFTDNFIPQNIRVFLSNITNDTGNHIYYFQLFHDDYDPEDFDGLAD